jgi:hypothetical protein
VDLFFEQTVYWTRLSAMQVPRTKMEIVRAALGDNAGIVGAAKLASER